MHRHRSAGAGGGRYLSPGGTMAQATTLTKDRKTKPRAAEQCHCAGCRGLATADPDFGFDRALVPGVQCLLCKQRIGKAPYILDAALARFGNMFFIHERCVSPAELKKQRAALARITERQSMRRLRKVS